MAATSRELVTQALTFQSPARIPRTIWVLPWAERRYPDEIREMHRRFPGDIGGVDSPAPRSSRARGSAYDRGEYVDEWGCVFTNIHDGVIGEVKQPLITSLDDLSPLRPPVETLPADVAAARDLVNRRCASTDRFIIAGCCPRPWERYQFLRGTENSLVDMMDDHAGVTALLDAIHAYYLKEVAFWVTTDVDAISFMDDWGSQRQLLIPPAVWRARFRPLYREYAQLARSAGKFVFMHSDGFIAEIYEDLVDIGVHAMNSQLGTMDLADLGRRVKGRITFWGEVDRQQVLPSPDPDAGRRAVREIARHLYDPAGGIIAQLEMGPGANPATAMAALEEWDHIGAGGP